jgi:hypothetical protein
MIHAKMKVERVPMKSLIRWTVVPLLSAVVLAQTSTPSPETATAKGGEVAVTAADLQALKDALAAQQQQIQQLQRALAQRDQAVPATAQPPAEPTQPAGARQCHGDRVRARRPRQRATQTQ